MKVLHPRLIGGSTNQSKGAPTPSIGMAMVRSATTRRTGHAWRTSSSDRKGRGKRCGTTAAASTVEDATRNHGEAPGGTGRKRSQEQRNGKKETSAGGNGNTHVSYRTVGSGVRLENVALAFKGQPLLRNVSWDVQRGERVGLVGFNGAGKTTQLKIITGEVEPDAGEILKQSKSMKVAYLTQEFEVQPNRTVREEFASVFEVQLNVAEEMENVQKELENATEDMEKMGKLLDRLEELQSKAETVDMYAVDKDIDQMMPQLGFTTEDNNRLVSTFSGGWQMRISLGKILLQKPDLLLLDEPTNHLDLDAVEWLEQFLKQQDVPMVIVSHDREFLDQLCSKIVETERGVTSTYMGNYSDYVRQKQENMSRQEVAYERQQKELDRLREMVSRLSGGGQSGRATAAQKEIDKIVSPENYIEKPWAEKRKSFHFPKIERPGQKVLEISNLTHGYNGNLLFEDAGLLVERGDKVAIIGPNGAGKSTLLRLVLGQEKPVEGRVELGEHNILVNYFVQNQAEYLEPHRTVLETLERAAPDAKMSEIKALLGRFNFKGDSMHKKVEWLSGGEKARLALAKFMLTPATVLILDEPTNHLDIPSKEALEEAVGSFEGSVVVVSHDRYFLKQIANRVIEVNEKQLQDYEGDYDYYLVKNKDAAEKDMERQAIQEEIQKKQTKAKSKVPKVDKKAAKKAKAKAFAAKNQVAKNTKKNAKRWN